MTLIEHLRELRNRLFWSFVAIALGTVVGWIFYNRLFTFIAQPLLDASNQLVEERARQADPVAHRASPTRSTSSCRSRWPPGSS